jgi:hypothetical protein
MAILTQQEEAEKLIDMKVHEMLWINSCQAEVIKVVGGWIYRSYDQEGKYIVATTFVPWNN